MEPDRSERSHHSGLPQRLPSDKSRIEDAGIDKEDGSAAACLQRFPAIFERFLSFLEKIPQSDFRLIQGLLARA